MKMDKKTIVLGVLVALAGITMYLANDATEKPAYTYPKVDVTIGPVDVTPEAEPEVIELPEVVITGKVSKGPVLHGSKLCRWYERAGIRAAHEAGEWLESTCEEDTCFLLVHETTVPSAYIMAGWLSEARQAGHDPRQDHIELSVFTFRGGEPYDHVIYFPSTDTFSER